VGSGFIVGEETNGRGQSGIVGLGDTRVAERLSTHVCMPVCFKKGPANLLESDVTGARA
jgi:hypothetical protein